MSIWLSLALLVGILLLAGMAVWMRRGSGSVGVGGAELEGGMSAEEEAVPMSPLQKRAWWGLGIGLALTLVIAAIFAERGFAAYWEDQGMRLTVLALFLGALIANLLLLRPVGRTGQEGGPVDERDRKIMSQAPVVQSAAMILALMGWSIGLTEIYHDEGAIPLVFPTLIAYSCVLVNALALSAGILIGYWREGRYA